MSSSNGRGFTIPNVIRLQAAVLSVVAALVIVQIWAAAATSGVPTWLWWALAVPVAVFWVNALLCIIFGYPPGGDPR